MSFPRRRLWQPVLLVCGLFLAGCEQVMVNGPVGGAMVSVQELRTGTVLVEQQFSDDFSAARARWPTFDSFNEFSRLTVLGIVLLNTLPVQEDSWYLVTATGGSDFGSAPNAAPNQVFGTVHALMTGRQLSAGGFVVGPLSEAAYQWLLPHLGSLDDADLESALDEATARLVGDLRDQDLAQINYDDLLTYNAIYNAPADYLGSAPALKQMQDALTQGSTDAGKRTFAVDMIGLDVPSNLALAVFTNEVSAPVSQGNCGPGCHLVNSGNIAATVGQHRLQPTSNPDHLALNTDMYRNLVAVRGVSGILNRASGQQGHGGGQRLTPGSADYQTFENFLELLQ